MRFATALPVAAWLAAAAPLLAPPPQPPAFHLPDDAAPRRHSVELTVDPRQSTFAGEVRIEVELRRSTALLWLHAKDLAPRRAAVWFAGRQHTAQATAAGGEFLALELDAPVGPGPAAVSVSYQGKLDDKAQAGLHRRKVGGDWYAFTTFTPIEARRAFPCFDEPRFKTPWEIALRVRAEDRAFSNAREASSTPESNGWKLVRFEATPPLPAEVVAFAVGPFEVVDGPVRVLAPRGRAAQGRFAADAAPPILKRLEEYTGTPYAFGKLDLVAMPDSPFGAVENPGLITFRQEALLLDPRGDTPQRRAAIRSTQAHEFAHQWFGNLVTQSDWIDVWLSEGFATWLAPKAAGETVLLPERRERFMQSDAAGRARAVRVPIASREASNDAYNQAVYTKAGAVLAMLEGWIGEQRFRDGLRLYLDRHRFATAATADLARGLRDAAGIDVSPVLATFLDARGVPQVEGALECGRRVLRITSTMPHVPVCWRSAAGSGCALVESAAEIAWPEGAACPAWYFLNAGGTGYYRTRWRSDPSAALPHLTESERLTLLYDLRATRAPFAALVDRLERETGAGK
jgi:alanyl aminopeptidase